MQLDRITRKGSVMGGQPCIRTTNVTATAVAGLLALGCSRDDILEAYPYLEAEDIRQVQAWVDEGQH
jgi:uncharacterized protein (DUF433 family)